MTPDRLIKCLVAAGLISLLAPNTSQAQTEMDMPLQGYLTGIDGAPVENPALTITVRIYTTPDGGEALYTESQAIPVESGYFTAYIGSVIDLDASLFQDYDTLFLGLQVSSDEEMRPRMELGSVSYAAYAHFAGDAASLDGITRESLGTLVDTWARSAAYDTEEELTTLLDDNYMAGDHVTDWSELSGIPEGFADGIDNDTTYDSTSPIALADTTFSLSSEGCEAGEVWEWNGSEWSCEPNMDFSGSAPIEIESGEISLSSEGCEAGDALRWNGSDWECSSFSGEDFALSDQECREGLAAIGIDADGELICSASGCPEGYVRLGESCIERDLSSTANPREAAAACFAAGARLCNAHELAYACQNRGALGITFPETWIVYDQASRIYWGGNYYIGYMIYRRRGSRCYGPNATSPSSSIYSWSYDDQVRNYACCRTAAF